MNIKILGLGGAGCEIAAYLIEKGIENSFVLINSDNKMLGKYPDGLEKIILSEDIFEGKGSGGDFEQVYEIAKENEEVKILLENNDIFIILFGFGGGIGMGLGKYFVEEIKARGKYSIVLAMIPFDFEYTSKRKKLINSVKNYISKNANEYYFYQLDIKDAPDKNITMDELFKYYYGKIENQIRKSLDSLKC